MTLATTIKCAECKKTIRNARPNQIYCSPACKKTAQRKRKTELVKPAEVTHEFKTLADAYAALTIRLRQRRRTNPGDLAERELNRAVDLLVNEMDAKLLSRRAKLAQTMDRETATVSEYISNFENTVEMMAPKTQEAASRRWATALQEVTPTLEAMGVGMSDDEGATFDAASLEEYEAILSPGERQVFVQRCEELLAMCGWDFDSLSLIANLVYEEGDARRSVVEAMKGNANSFTLKSQALRRRKLEAALALDAEAEEKMGAVTAETGLLRGFLAELHRSPEELECEAQEDARAKLASDASLYESGILEGPPPPDVQAEIERRKQEQSGEDSPQTLSELIRSSDTPF